MRRRYESTRFVTETLANGAQVSKWTPVVTRRSVPTGAPGVVGSIVDKMHAGNDTIRHVVGPKWTPPAEYEFIAERLPAGERAAYIARCEAWFAENPPRVPAPRPEVRVLDTDAVVKLFEKHHPQLPPLEERLAVYRKVGYSEEYVKRARARAEIAEETADERQKALDLIFAKWPAASKAVPKKGTVIKAVKKRLPGQDA